MLTIIIVNGFILISTCFVAEKSCCPRGLASMILRETFQALALVLDLVETLQGILVSVFWKS